MKKLGILMALAIGIIANPALAQLRALPPEPGKLEYQPPKIDPMIKRLNAMQSQLDALRQSAGKQVVVLHFTPSELPGWADNIYANNQQRSADLCKQALDDRYGRVISYRVWTNDDRFFFSHVVCETKP